MEKSLWEGLGLSLLILASHFGSKSAIWRTQTALTPSRCSSHADSCPGGGNAWLGGYLRAQPAVRSVTVWFGARSGRVRVAARHERGRQPVSEQPVHQHGQVRAQRRDPGVAGTAAPHTRRPFLPPPWAQRGDNVCDSKALSCRQSRPGSAAAWPAVTYTENTFLAAVLERWEGNTRRDAP